MSKSAEDIEKELFEKKIDGIFAGDLDKEEIKSILTGETLSTTKKTLLLKFYDLTKNAETLNKEGLKIQASIDEYYKIGIPRPGGGLSPLSRVKKCRKCATVGRRE
ncbi:MAG: hypothetical protein JWM09_563 [Francisellaceae bacterium]|nr:hypothetical protein [Francisellaceae bacterium]